MSVNFVGLSGRVEKFSVQPIRLCPFDRILEWAPGGGLSNTLPPILAFGRYRGALIYLYTLLVPKAKSLFPYGRPMSYNFPFEKQIHYNVCNYYSYRDISHYFFFSYLTLFIYHSFDAFFLGFILLPVVVIH